MLSLSNAYNGKLQLLIFLRKFPFYVRKNKFAKQFKKIRERKKNNWHVSIAIIKRTSPDVIKSKIEKKKLRRDVKF